MRNVRLLLILVLITLLVSAFAPVQAQSKGPDPVGLRPDAPTYAVHGPFWVGVRTFVVDPKADRPLRGLIWYPAANPKGLPEKTDYQNADMQWFTIPEGISTFSPGHALRDADVDLSKGPYPLVINSHAYWGHPETTAPVSEHLASYGFVVMAPYHTGETGDDFNLNGWKSYINRPKDIQRVIAYAETIAKNGALKGLIDVGTIGSVGWSSGGYTALMAGGARIDFTAFEKWCADPANKEDPDAQGECPAVLSHKNDMLAIAKLNTMPTGPWPSWGDPRVKGIVSDSGGDRLTSYAAITVPMMVMTGGLEPVSLNMTIPYENAASTQKAGVVFENADHFVFAPTCDEMPYLLPSFPMYYGVCAQSVWDMARAHDLINHLTTAFLLDTLKGDKAAHKALLPDAVKFAGIEYQTTMQ